MSHPGPAGASSPPSTRHSSSSHDHDSLPPSPPSPPFLLKLFPRLNAYHRPDEFILPSSAYYHRRHTSSDNLLPAYIPVHTWPSCTLLQLAHHLFASVSAEDQNVAAVVPLPSPAVGMRLAFRLLYADVRMAPMRYTAKDLGSFVVGGVEDEGRREGGRRRIKKEDEDAEEGGEGEDEGEDVSKKTLADVKFVIGDYISIAIFPPDPVTGTIAPASAARSGPRGEEKGRPRASHSSRPSSSSGRPSREHPWPRYRGSDQRDIRHPNSGRRGSGGGSRRDRDRDFGGTGATGIIPAGEWRRGEEVPRPPARRSEWVEGWKRV